MQDSVMTNRAIRAAQADALFMPVPLVEALAVRTKARFNTACWSYLPPHRIYVGLDIVADGLKAGRIRKDATDFEPYLQKFFHHERAHALYTRRSDGSIKGFLAEINACLINAGLSFELLNLFEDARIEERYRRENAYRFAWLDYEVLGVAVSPDALFFSAIQSENSLTTFSKGLPPGDSSLQQIAGEVWAFYQDALAASNTESLIPILKRWVARFGLPPKGKSTRDDMELSAKLAGEPSFRDEFEKEDIPQSAEVSQEQDQPAQAYEGQGTRVVKLSDKPWPIDAQAVSRIAQSLERALRAKEGFINTHSPSKRIAIKGLSQDRPPYRKKVVEVARKRKLLLVVDCSGSMEGYPIATARLLVAALSELARSSKVEGHVVFSAVIDQLGSWDRYALPMPANLIERISAPGAAEGLNNALRGNMDIAASADHTFVFTDGFISDRSINKGALHSRGIHTIGLYTPTEGGEDIAVEVQSKLLGYFDKAIVRSNALELVGQMVKELA